MKISAFGRGLALAVLYIGILLGLVLLQFRAGGDFTLVASGITLKGRAGEQEGSLVSGSLSFGGLVLTFSPAKPLAWTAQDGSGRTALPKSYKELKDGFLILFTDGLELRARSSGEPGTRGSFEFARKTGPLRDVTVAVSAARRSRLVQESDAYLLSGSAGRFVLEVPEGAVSPDRRNLSLPFVRGRIVPASLAKAQDGMQTASPRFLEQAALDPAVFQREIAAFRDKAWKGLSSDRFQPGTLEWKDSAGKPGFSEAALTAYLAEAWSRGQGPSAFERVQAANDLHAGSLTYLSVPFLGRTTDRMRAFEEADLLEVKRLERLVQTRNPSLLEKPGLVRFLLDRAPYALARDAFQMVGALDLGSLSVAQAAGGLAAWAEAEDLFGSGENPFSRFAGIPERQILPYVHRAGDGYFLATGPDGTSALEISIRAGLSLIRLGESTVKPMFTGIGQSLVLGALRLADSQGFLPRAVVVRNGAVAERLETLAPEEAYPLVAGNPYYPREVSFFREVGPGAWMWTCSPKVSISADAERMVWTLEFPEQGVHYIAAYGVKPFAKMQLYGLDYPMDPAFENYNASGYLYRRASNVVYFKMRHKSRTEDIRMYY